MAQIPYTSEIKSKKIATDLATRLYQFMQVSKLIDGLSVLNGSKQNTEDLTNLSAKLERLYTGYMNNDLKEQEDIDEATKIFKDEELMDVADRISDIDSEEEKLAQIYSYTAQKMSHTVMSETQSWNQLQQKGIAESTELNLTGTLFIVLEKENRKIDSEDFATRIIEGNLEPQEIPTAVYALQSARQKVIERMKADWQTYEDSRTPNPNIEKFRQYFESILTDTKKFNYKTYPETRNVLLCIRDDFADKDNGSKTAFLKMMGCLLDDGHKQMTALTPNSAKIYNDKNYNQFIDLIKKQYPNDTDNVINTMLNVTDGNNTEQERRAAFDKKSKEFYGKFLSAILVKKKEQNDTARVHNFNYSDYITGGVAKYIAELKEGKNNIAANLLLVDESKAKSLKQLIDDTAENQIISVHHKIPVASAVPLYVMQHKELHTPQKTQEFIRELAEICPQAVQDRTAEDVLTIGLALSVFPEESRRDNLAAIRRIPDKKEREKQEQIIKNKDAIRELYPKYFPMDFAAKSAAKQEILHIVNNPSNHTLPIGNLVHQKMEPNGDLTISKPDEKLFINVQNTSRLGTTTTDKVNNDTIFAAEYDRAKYAEIVKTLKPAYQQELALYNKGNEQTITSRVSLNMPETGFMRRMRNMLNTAQRISPIQELKKAIGMNK